VTVQRLRSWPAGGARPKAGETLAGDVARRWHRRGGALCMGEQGEARWACWRPAASFRKAAAVMASNWRLSFTWNGDQNTNTMASCDGNAHRRNLRSPSPSPSSSCPGAAGLAHLRHRPRQRQGRGRRTTGWVIGPTSLPAWRVKTTPRQPETTENEHRG